MMGSGQISRIRLDLGRCKNSEVQQTKINEGSVNPSTITRSAGHETATLAGGCFWCLEAVYDQMKGVVSVVSGYIGGQTSNPTYEAVCGGRSGHAEAVRITFDPTIVTYRELLEVFFVIHDPTTLNRQGHDVGTQYRSAIFYHSLEQKRIAEEVIALVTKEQIYPNPLVTEVTAAGTWYEAEPYHQGYFARNPFQGYCTAVVGPKVVKFRQQFASKMKA
jgi:peptide-methionine (S)-S-oxide reductase